MSGEVVVLLPASDGAPLVWGRREGRKVKWGAVSQGASAPSFARDAVVIAPGTDVSAFTVAVPPGGETQARTAALYALEDEVAVDLDGLHVALGPKPKSAGPRLVLVVAKARMAAWLAQLADAKITARIMTVDFLAFAREGEETRIADLGDRVLVAGPAGGFSVERDLAARVMADALSPGARLRIAADTPDAISPPQGWPADALREPALSEEGYLGALLDGLDAAGGTIELRQGALAPRRFNAGDVTQYRRPLILAGLAGAAWLGWALLEGQQMRAHTRAAEDGVAALYAQTFPNAGRTANPARVLNQRATSVAGPTGGTFLSLSALVFEAVEELEAVRVESMTYDAAREGLALTVTYDAFADLEALSAAIEARGGLLEEGASRRRAERTSGDLVVRMR